MNELSEIEQQRQYYRKTALEYERRHVRQDDEHHRALEWLAGVVNSRGFSSVLDVGAGTGRVVAYLKKHAPAAKVVGIEPSDALRAVGYQNGLTLEDLLKGDATSLDYCDNDFDVVCEFGVLHHIRKPRVAVSEMLRVARRAVFISDDNHFAAGSRVVRVLKRSLRAFGLWNTAYKARTAGKGYRISEGDGISYPYSVFDDLDLIKRKCPSVFLMNTTASSGDLYRTANHVAVLALKNP
jgi:ubiquinone/menaquinone biosynthesis C-methylase UbiE